MHAKWGYKPPKLATLHSVYGSTGNSTTITPTPLPPPHSPTHIPLLSPPHPALNSTRSDDQVKPQDCVPSPSLLLSYSLNKTPPSIYTYLRTLRHNFDNSIPNTITFMQDLQEYTEDCLYEHAEWKADQHVEINENHNISYPK